MANDFTKAAASIEKLSTDIERQVDSELGDVFDDMAVTARRHLVDEGSVVTGELGTSVRHHDATADSTSVTGKTGYAAHTVRAAAPYAAYVEYGTGLNQRGTPVNGEQFDSPSVPPLGAILEWMAEKPVYPQKSVEGMSDHYAVAQDIANTIARYGQQPHPYMRPAWRRHRTDISHAHSRGVQTALRRL